MQQRHIANRFAKGLRASLAVALAVALALPASLSSFGSTPAYATGTTPDKPVMTDFTMDITYAGTDGTTKAGGSYKVVENGTGSNGKPVYKTEQTTAPAADANTTLGIKLMRSFDVTFYLGDAARDNGVKFPNGTASMMSTIFEPTIASATLTLPSADVLAQVENQWDKHTILNWYDEATGNAVNTGDAVDKDMTVVANWASEKEVYFNPNGGEIPDYAASGAEMYDEATGTVLKPAADGHAVVPVKDPVRKGYVFDYWFTGTAATGHPGDDSKAYNTGAAVTEQVFLYAKWTPVRYQVTYDATCYTEEGNFIDSDAGTSPVTGFAYDAATGATFGWKPARTGFTFTGWNIYGGPSGATSDANGNVTIPAGWADPSNLRLSAKWEPNLTNSGSISFDANVEQGTDGKDHWVGEGSGPNGGTDLSIRLTGAENTEADDFGNNSLRVTFYPRNGQDPQVVTVNRGELVSAPNFAQLEGFRWSGWTRILPNGSTVVFDVANIPVTQSMDLYGKWDGLANDVLLVFPTGMTTPMNASAEVQEVSTGVYKVTDPGDFYGQIGAYRVVSWYRDANFTGDAFSFDQTYAQVPSSLYAKCVANIKLYKAEPGEDGTDVTVDFEGITSWSAVTDGSGGDWQTSYQFGSTGLTFPVDVTNASKPKDKFLGWAYTYTDNNGKEHEGLIKKTDDDIAGIVVGANLLKSDKFYAKFEHMFSVTFNVNGGDAATQPDDQLIAEGDKATQPAVPTREGHTFTGWFQDAACTDQWAFDTNTVTSDITLYAGWSVNSYTVTFNSNGGSNVADKTVNYGEKIDKPSDPTKEGYELVGWFKESSCTNAWVFETDTMPANDITLYAKWATKTYTVTFNSNGGGTVAPQTVEYGGTATKPSPDPVREGYDFVEWRVGSDTGAAYNFATPVTDNITLVAAWKIKTYTVTFDVNGGTYTGNSSLLSQTVNHGSKVTRPTPDPTLASHDFLGWFKKDSDGNFTGSAWDFDNTPVTEAMTLYAKWSTNTYIFKYYSTTADTAPVEVECNADDAVTMLSDADLKDAEGNAKTGIDGHKLSHWYVTAGTAPETGTDGRVNMAGNAQATADNYFTAGTNTGKTAKEIAEGIGVTGKEVSLYATWTPIITATAPLRTAVEFGSATSMAVGPEMAIESTTPRALDIAAYATVKDAKAQELLGDIQIDSSAITSDADFWFPGSKINGKVDTTGASKLPLVDATATAPAGVSVGTVPYWPQPVTPPGTGTSEDKSKRSGMLCIQFSENLMNTLRTNVGEDKEVKDFAQLNWTATMQSPGEWLYANANSSTTAF